MSDQEKVCNYKIRPNEHIMVRLDGHKFSKFTKGFTKPFDNIIGDAMKKVTEDLVMEFNAFTGYTQSDEITLFIPSLLEETGIGWRHDFNGRIQKLNSLITSFTTVKFNEYMNDHRIEKKAMFDCRVYGVPTKNDVFLEFLERMRNAEKNSKSVFAHTYCPHKYLQNLNGQEMVDLCLDTYEINWDDIETRYKYGVIVKKKQIEKKVSNEWYEGCVKRNIIHSWSQKMYYNGENIDTICAKYVE